METRNAGLDLAGDRGDSEGLRRGLADRPLCDAAASDKPTRPRLLGQEAGLGECTLGCEGGLRLLLFLSKSPP